jgi:hypothetical protein
MTQVKDYESLIDQCSMILRPGGLIDVNEFDFRSHGHDRKPIIADEAVLEPPWLGRWMSLCTVAVRHRGGDVDAADHLHRWLSEHEAFEDVVYRAVHFPASPFLRPDEPNAQFWNSIGASMRDDVQVLIYFGSFCDLRLGLTSLIGRNSCALRDLFSWAMDSL